MTKTEMNTVLWVALQGLARFPEVIAEKLELTKDELKATEQLVLRELLFQGDEE